MAFWFNYGFWLEPGKSMAIEYWLHGASDVGAQVATPVPLYSDAAGVVAVNQGLRYDRSTGKFYYVVGITNFGSEGAGFQIRGGGLV